MTNPDDIQTLVRAVAEWCGCIKTFDHPTVRHGLVSRTVVRFSLPPDDDCSFDLGEELTGDIILFAAYVKAEMAKRWRNVFSLSGVGTDSGSVQIYKCGHSGETRMHNYDHTDPLSEARAIIAAAHEAMQREGEG